MLFGRRHTILTLVAAGAAALLLAGCGSDSSGPQAPTAAQDAKHYDSLASALIAIGTAPAATQAAGITIFNGVIADGVLPTPATVVVNGNTNSWYANFANLVDSAQTDSAQIISLWNSTRADSMVFLQFLNGTVAYLQDIVGGGLVGNSAAGSTASGSFGSPSGSCSFTTIVNVFPTYPTYDPSQSTCQLETATGGINATFNPVTDTPTDSIHTFSVATGTVYGVRLQFTSSAAYSSAVAKALTTTAAAKRLGQR